MSARAFWELGILNLDIYVVRLFDMYCYRYFVSRCDFHLVAFHLYLCSFIAWKLSLEFSVLCVSTSVKRDIVGIDENNSPPSMELMCLSFHRKVSSSDELMKFAF